MIKTHTHKQTKPKQVDYLIKVPNFQHTAHFLILPHFSYHFRAVDLPPLAHMFAW